MRMILFLLLTHCSLSLANTFNTQFIPLSSSELSYEPEISPYLENLELKSKRAERIRLKKTRKPGSIYLDRYRMEREWNLASAPSIDLDLLLVNTQINDPEDAEDNVTFYEEMKQFFDSNGSTILEADQGYILALVESTYTDVIEDVIELPIRKIGRLRYDNSKDGYWFSSRH